MNVDPCIRLIENSNHYSFARSIIVSKRTVVELEQGDHATLEIYEALYYFRLSAELRF